MPFFADALNFFHLAYVLALCTMHLHLHLHHITASCSHSSSLRACPCAFVAILWLIDKSLGGMSCQNGAFSVSPSLHFCMHLERGTSRLGAGLCIFIAARLKIRSTFYLTTSDGVAIATMRLLCRRRNLDRMGFEVGIALENAGLPGLP